MSHLSLQIDMSISRGVICPSCSASVSAIKYMSVWCVSNYVMNYNHVHRKPLHRKLCGFSPCPTSAASITLITWIFLPAGYYSMLCFALFSCYTWKVWITSMPLYSMQLDPADTLNPISLTIFLLLFQILPGYLWKIIKSCQNKTFRQ